MKTLSLEGKTALLEILSARFNKNKQRHEGILWSDVSARLDKNEDKLWSLDRMEETEGEPDVIGIEQGTGAIIFCDCSAESPKGRRSICYDHKALESRKENKPSDSAINMAEEMGIELMDEAQYRHLQQLGNFDNKTSSWVLTPSKIRNLGGALFCDKRYDTVFLYHNGADSYYAARGFRGILKI